MKNLNALTSASLRSKFIWFLFIGAVPLITNCSQAKYGETTKVGQAPTPAALAPKALPAATPVPVKSPTVKSVVSDDTTTAPKNTSVTQLTKRSNGETTPFRTQNITPVGISSPQTPCPVLCGAQPAPVQQQVPKAPQSVLCQGGTCHKSHFMQNFAYPVQNVDVLFVIDSNGSLKEQKFALFQKIDSLLNSLPSELSYHFAILNTQDTQATLFAPKAGSSQVIAAELNTMTETSREAYLAGIKQDIWERISSLDTQSFVGTSEFIMRRLDAALSPPELQNNQANGFFRSDAGLVVISMTDERVRNQVSTSMCADLAKNIYQKIVALKTIQVNPLTQILEIRPIEFIGFALLDSEEAMNHERNVSFNSDMLELLHLADGVLIDLAEANANPDQMQADLRYAGDQVVNMWMKRRFQIKPSRALDPSSVCFIANGVLYPTNYIPELGEVRINRTDSLALRSATTPPDSATGLLNEVLWCENGQTANYSKPNIYEINVLCSDRKAEFKRLAH